MVILAIGAVTLTRTSNDGEQIAAKTLPRLSSEDAVQGIAVGNKVPNFDIRLISGDTISAANLVEEDKPAFYYFFATW